MSWDNLTEYEKSLDKAIERSGLFLYNTKSCLEDVMNKNGASSNVAEFVKSRIQLRIKVRQIIEDTDLVLANTEEILEKFQENEKEMKRIGEKLGYEFL